MKCHPFNIPEQSHFHHIDIYHFISLPSGQDFQKHWQIVGIKLLSLKDPDWQRPHWKLGLCRGVSGWAGPDADAVVHFGRWRGEASGSGKPEQTHQIWRRSREKGSAASLQSQPGKSIPKRHTEFKDHRSTLASSSTQLPSYTMHCT